MKSILKILVGAICLCSCVTAQIKYDQHPIAQKVRYDDDEAAYQHYQQPQKYGIVRESLLGGYGNKYGDQHAPAYERPFSSPYPQPQSYSSPPARHASYYPQKTELPLEYPAHYHSNEPAYLPAQESHGRPKSGEEYNKPKSEDPKLKAAPYEQPEELQYSHEPEKPSYYQPSPVPETSLPPAPYQPVHQTSHYSSTPPKTPYPATAESYQPSQQSSHHPSNPPETSYPQAAVSYQPSQLSNHYPSTSLDTSYPSAGASYQPAQQTNHYPSSTPETSYPQAAPSYHPDQQSYPPPSSAKRDPKLPLYFTMYEKRIIQDPTDKYGKGPWRYLTYGHGITYGSKEPGKVFEKGYGYIRALGRDHCKQPENQCPPRDDKPFEYDGRKEPYFGYRPH